MRRSFAFAGFLLAFVLAEPISAADETAKTDGDSDKISTARELTGKVTKISSQPNTFTLRVKYQYLEPNTGHRSGSVAPKEVQHLIKQQQELARLQTQIENTRSPAKRLAKLQQFTAKLERQQIKQSHAQHLPYKTVTRHQSLQLLAKDEVIVRLARPDADFEEPGKRKLKGSDKLWGYPGDWSNLQTGQLVKVFLAKKKNEAATEKEATDDRKTDDKKPEVAMIYILENAKKK